MKSVLPQSQKYHKESKQTNIPHEHGYKILTKVIADQILKYIKNFKQHEKAGYYKMQGWFNILKLITLIQHINRIKKPKMIISINSQK